MKSAFRYFLFLWIITASINNVNAENLTFMVGDDAGVGNLNGPSGDKLISFSYPVGGVNNIVFYNPTSTTPTNAKIKLYWSELDTSSSRGFVYCTSKNNSSGMPITVRHNMVDSGKMADGHRLYETNVTGLYYTLMLNRFWSYELRSSSPDIYVGDDGWHTVQFSITGDYIRGQCNTSRYQAVGGLLHDATVEFYTDSSFNPAPNTNVQLKHTGDYLYSFANEGPGVPNVSASKMLKINFNLTDINIQLPTCFTSILLGESVTRSTVNLGEYTVGQITSDSATPVNFQISLQNCVRINSIKTKLKSNVVGVNNPLLLGNTLTGTDDAKGAGVLIEGLPNSKNSQNFTLKPNDETSSYNDAEDDPGENNGIYNPDYPNANGRTTTQDLKFQATLKRDGNATVKPGGFKATSTFQVTYE
ncbi:TPA: fimbrial-like adhesin [Escherichia coli]|nr:fimbrial-like adhesin [Escherichia coli]HAM6536557.1 fimbrial-like adhesin [Escherichia coli]